jgi:hypothetical protein
MEISPRLRAISKKSATEVTEVTENNEAIPLGVLCDLGGYRHSFFAFVGVWSAVSYKGTKACDTRALAPTESAGTVSAAFAIPQPASTLNC